MTRRNRSRIVMILDRSGSMQPIRRVTINGFNEFLNKMKAAPGEISIKLVQFDDEYETVFDLPVQEAPPLTQETFVPRGMTALLDAQGRTIADLGAELSTLSESERPEKVLVVTITDGQENASQHYSTEQIATMVRHQRSVYSWEFVYLGANQDAIGVAGGMGIPAMSSMTFAANDIALASVLSSLSRHTLFNLSKHRAISFTDEERMAAMATNAE